MTTAAGLPEAVGHVRNAVWRLMADPDPGRLDLAMDCLDLEALLNPDDLDPVVAPAQTDAAADLAAAQRLLDAEPDAVAPAAWAALRAITIRLG